ncbi:RluA family pseudouridine synthase [Desulfonispora thiosulfatigenes]|uniref:RluA family pseudouridine synthase n=1 Tax=Desulfonispora thiosulfatigenes TaxID=83661 RepID=UPI0013566540|nr:RluA family pseudouridine synthase [Desulfonispora thiosulfatigenes]
MKNEESIHIFTFIVEDIFTSYTIKEFLKNKFFSDALLIKIKKEGKVYLNNNPVRLYQKLKGFDQLMVDIGEELYDESPFEKPLEIIYEDNDLLLINKDPFLVTHPTRNNLHNTLANVIAFYFQQNNLKAKFRFINRLDKNTSGVIMVSKNLHAHNFVQNQIREQKVKKVYWAVVEGKMKNKQGLINAPIARENTDNIVRKVAIDGKEALTSYRVLEEYNDSSLVELNPLTGRTHQLRVHMKYIGHPIIGDDLYNEEKSKFIKRQALHARSIEFILPRGNKNLFQIAELTEDINNLIEILKC